MNSFWKKANRNVLFRTNSVYGGKLIRQFMVGLPRKEAVRTLQSVSKGKFGSLSIISRGFLVAKLSKVIGSRAGIYRLLLVGSLFVDRNIMMSVSDYINNLDINEEQMFQIFGVLKPGSIELKRGSLQAKFAITDFKNEIEVFYKGTNKLEFKEGETVVLTCYLPDKTKKKVLFCVDYLVKHSMEVNDWQDKNNVRRDAGMN